MSQRPAAFEMQPATPRRCYSPCSRPPFVHSAAAPSIPPSIQLILCCVWFIHAKVRVPLNFNMKSLLQHSPMHSSPHKAFHYKCSFIPSCLFLSIVESSLCSLKANRLILHGLVPFLTPFFPNPNTPQPFCQRHSALASSPHCSLVCKHCARR